MKSRTGRLDVYIEQGIDPCAYVRLDGESASGSSWDLFKFFNAINYITVYDQQKTLVLWEGPTFSAMDCTRQIPDPAFMREGLPSWVWYSWVEQNLPVEVLLGDL